MDIVDSKLAKSDVQGSIENVHEVNQLNMNTKEVIAKETTHLCCRAICCKQVEPNDVSKEDCNTFKVISSLLKLMRSLTKYAMVAANHLFILYVSNHRRRKKIMKSLLSFLFFLIKLLHFFYNLFGKHPGIFLIMMTNVTGLQT